MRFVDEKGRLFGVINIIDLCILVIIVLIIGVAGYKLAGSRLNRSEINKKEILVTIKCPMSIETTAKAIHPGDRFLTGSDYVNGVVESVTYNDAYDTIETADGRFVWAKHPVLKDIHVVVKMKENPQDPLLKLGSQEMRIGKQIFMKTQRVELLGIIDNIEVR